MLEIRGYEKYSRSDHIKIYTDGLYCADLIYEQQGSDELYIHMIRVVEKFRRKGIGMQIITRISKLYPTVKYVRGNSKPTDEALGFWESLGAEFVKDKDILIKNNELVPFAILIK